LTPAARVAAAIGILDQVLDGAAGERILTTWARQNRYAGSKDRAAIRDHVFDAIRCQQSYGALGHAQTGRGMMIGALRAAGQDPETFFTGEGYAPPALSPQEAAPAPQLADLPETTRLDCPPWLAPRLRSALGDDFAPVMTLLRTRAPVFVRANLARGGRDAALQALSRDEIGARAHPLSPTAIEITANPRKVNTSSAFVDGWVELQDAASQAVVDVLPTPAGARVLDYCAGGGGKALAIAARGDVNVFAHDINPDRMKDIAIRAQRAGVSISQLDGGDLDAHAPFDLVLADAPCSGSGSWRRAPQGKWALTEERLHELCAIQGEILDEIQGLVGKDGVLAYATCSLLECENTAQIKGFLDRHPQWRLLEERQFTPLDGGDGFYIATLKRA